MALLVAAAGWALLGTTLLLSRVGAPPSNRNPVAPGVENAVETVAPQTVADGSSTWWWVSYLPVLGVVVLLVVGLLLAGQGWARYVLLLAGLVAVVGYAQAGQLHVLPAAVFLVVASAAGVMPSAHRYLTGPRTAATPT